MLGLVAVLIVGSLGAGADERRYTIAFANLTEEPGATLGATGFTGREVRESFVLAARRLPVDLVFYDNRRDSRTALDNAGDAVRRRVDLFIEYFHEPGANEAVARAWQAADVIGVVVGAVSNRHDGVPERVQGLVDGLRRRQPSTRIVSLDTQGNPATVATLIGKLLAAQPKAKLLVAALDDTTALAAKSALEAGGRLADAAIVGFGCDRSIHGGANDRKEIDPSNRGSIVLGSVAFYLDRYGYDVLPLALRVLRGERVPSRTMTAHKLITAANVFREYPPYDMQ